MAADLGSGGGWELEPPVPDLEGVVGVLVGVTAGMGVDRGFGVTAGTEILGGFDRGTAGLTVVGVASFGVGAVAPGRAAGGVTGVLGVVLAGTRASAGRTG